LSSESENTPEFETATESTIEQVEQKNKLEKLENEKKIKLAKEKIKKEKELENKKLEDEAKEQAKIEFDAEQKLIKQTEKDEKSRLALIEKIIENALENKLLINKVSLSKMSLESLNMLYLGMVKRTLKEYKIKCTKGCGYVDFSNSKEEAIQKRNKHSKICEKKSNYGNWIILGFVLVGLSSIAVALHSHSKKKSNEDPQE